MTYKYTCCKADNGKTVKQIIAENFSVTSRSLSKLKFSGGIALNGQTVTVRHEVYDGDILTLTFTDINSSQIKPENISLDIIFENSDILAVNKPSAMPTHPSAGHYSGTLANAVMFRYRGVPFTFRPVTRLDGDTTGIVLIAKNAPVCAKLSELLANGNLQKQYLAICENVPEPKSGSIDAAISREPGSRIKRRVSPDGKSAVTFYETLKVLGGGKYSLIRCFPKTGRTHQIRLHMSHIGCPLYGDFLYGTQNSDTERALLHCEKLSFSLDGKNVTEIVAPMPQDFKDFISKHE